MSVPHRIAAAAGAAGPQRRLEVKPARTRLRKVMRALAIPAGWMLIALGVLVGPLPGPGGIPVIALGVVILLRHSHWARRRFIRWRRRYPKLLRPVENVLRRKKRQPPPESWS